MAFEPTDDGFHNEVKTVTIRIFSSHETAELARSNLEAHDIKCWVNADDCGGMYPNLTAPGGVRLLVLAADAEAAIALLNAPASPTELKQIETEVAASTPAETVSLKRLAMGQIVSGIVFGIFTGILLCLLYQWANNLGTKTNYYYTTDGKCYEARVYQNGHLVEAVQDRNLDGVWDHWIYYAHGQVVRSEWDNNFDGKPDEFVTYSNGAPTTFEKDTDFNGVPDEFGIYKYGILQQVDFRPNGAKYSMQRWIYKNGVLTEILRGGDSNGNFKEVVRYDPFFNPISTNIPTAFQLSSSPK
jgi:hypothetical protein